MKTYKDIFGYFSFEPYYDRICNTFLKDGMKIAEIGAFHGKSTSFMASKIKKKGLDVEFHVIDHWLGSSEHQGMPEIVDMYQTFTNNMISCSVDKYVTPHQMISVEAAKLFQDKYFDFVFIDASHEYELLKEDIQAWAPKVKTGGIIAGDDYHTTWPDVMKAVNDCFGLNVKKDCLPAWYVHI